VRRFASPIIALAALVSGAATLAGAEQTPAGPDTLRLAVLHQQAVAGDPRQRQFLLLSRQTDLRLENLSDQRLPILTVEAGAQYQSDVFSIGNVVGGGTTFPLIPKDTYDGRISVEQPIIDPTIGPRQDVERAQLAESEARVRTSLFGLREEVNEAFFTTALLTERNAIIETTILDLEKRLQEARVRVREGAALPSDTAAIQATLLERRQELAEIVANRRAALNRLSELTHRTVSADQPLALPDLRAETDQARQELARLRVRPEYEEFARTRDRLTEQEVVIASEQQPRFSAFGRVGYGNPGLNPLNEGFDSYYIAGLEVKWSPWNWGSTGREQEALTLQRDILTAEEETFTSSLTRATQNDIANMDRLDSTLVLDEQIVLLRERVERETRIRFQEGVITASEYLDRNTEVLQARLARATHRIEQIQARARFLTTLGLEIR
jgi:outer membrane protein TolC